MPPINTDSEDSEDSLEEIPARPKATKVVPVDDVEDEGDDDEDGDDGEGEYVVEKIQDHMFDEAGVLRLQVKWKGYDNPKDLTWEPEENLLEDVRDMLEEYYDKIGGRPTRQKKTAGRKRSRDHASSTPQSSSKGSKNRRLSEEGSATFSATPPASVNSNAKSETWAPPLGSWEGEVHAVDTIEQDRKGLQVYLQWESGKKSMHSIKTVKEKCPMKLLEFYEQHLVFKPHGKGPA